MSNPAAQPKLAVAAEMLREHRGLFQALAISWIVLGALCILAPSAAGFAVALVVAWALLLGGVAQLVHAFRVRPWSGSALSFLWAIANMVAGVLLLTRPLESVLTLTVILSVFLLWEGAAKIVLAFRIRPHPSWTGFLLSGGLALALGFLLFAGLPGTATWALGTFVGINMIFGGIALWRFARHAV
jgi:uncharacterized membrane protein HdeD (DUF308 family)